MWVFFVSSTVLYHLGPSDHYFYGLVFSIETASFPRHPAASPYVGGVPVFELNADEELRWIVRLRIDGNEEAFPSAICQEIGW